MYIWDYVFRGCQVCKTATKAQFYKELELEYSESEREEILQNVKFTRLYLL